ncbi:unnamed protein product [Mycena citricolor]|uniref:Uncharacterized protein n=1 Tax=Mycena citricolor TaxID=2018698 RepID=A0AAD2K7V0_9AGAR|nr:unnamed protein product [Mycena citricolor]
MTKTVTGKRKGPKPPGTVATRKKAAQAQPQPRELSPDLHFPLSPSSPIRVVVKRKRLTRETSIVTLDRTPASPRAQTKFCPQSFSPTPAASRKTESDADDEDEDGDADEEGIDELDSDNGSLADNEDDPNDNLPVVKIEFTVLCFHEAQMKNKTPKPFLTGSFRGDTSDTWPTIQEDLQACIVENFEDEDAKLQDYYCTYTIPYHRVASTPRKLDSLKAFQELVDFVCEKPKEKPTEIRISASKKPSKNNGNSSSEEQSSKKSKSKKASGSQAPNAKTILPSNMALVNEIGDLKTLWTCPTPEKCGVTHCFYDKRDPSKPHFPLSHAQFGCWGAGNLKGVHVSTRDMPPNSPLFDALHAGGHGYPDDLRSRREALTNKKMTVPTAPPVTIVFPPEIAQFLGGNGVRTTLPIGPSAPLETNCLIPSHLGPGPLLSIATFCQKFELSDRIRAKFEENDFDDTSGFAFTSTDQMEKMQFSFGQINTIRARITQWAMLQADG